MIRIFIKILSIFPLLALGLAAAAIPARHGWLPLWPASLVEVVYSDDAGDIHREVFEPVSGPEDGRWLLRRGGPSGEIVSLDMARVNSFDRPRSAAVVEDREDVHHFGYLVGVRDGEEGQLLEDASEWIDADLARYADEASPMRLIVQSPEGRSAEFAFSDIQRVYRPNRMGRAKHFSLFLSRLREHRIVESDAVASASDSKADT